MTNFQQNIKNMFFGPLGKESCNFFLFISVIAFFTMIVFAISLLFYIIYMMKKRESITSLHVTNGCLVLFNLFMSYFINRIFYNMCIKTM
jgi:hypothetical protein